MKDCCLTTYIYVCVCVCVMWSNPGEGVATFATPRCSSYWKGSIGLPSTTLPYPTCLSHVRFEDYSKDNDIGFWDWYDANWLEPLQLLV